MTTTTTTTTTTTNPKTISFFGATGGCAFATLWRSLAAGHHCRVLARNPTKLLTMLQARNISATLLSAPFLEIIKGDAKDVDDVKNTLVFGNSGDGGKEKEAGKVADVIISGVGGQPILQFNLRYPITMEDPRICYNHTFTILKALNSIREHSHSRQPSIASTSASTSSNLKASASPTPTTQLPLLVLVSSAGVATEYRDFPFLYFPIYRWLINMQLEDKRAAHALVVKAASSSSSSPLLRYTSLRPTNLVDGEAKGMANVREGVGRKYVRGYLISREDVGGWIYERCIREQKGGVREEYVNAVVGLTY